MAQRYIGLLSGTSMDAVDAALVELGPLRILATHSIPMPPALRRQLFAVIERRATSLEELGTLDIRLGRLFAETALELLARAKFPAAEVQAIGSHGQTIYHWIRGPPLYFTAGRS